MKLTFANDLGQTFSLEIDSGMELENVMALLEAEAGIPVSEQAIHFRDQELLDPKKTMLEYGIPDDAVLLLRRKVASEFPELAQAALNDPSRFVELLRRTRERQHEAELQHQHELQRLNDDPFDVEAQTKIEEHIRQEAVLENMQHALEYSPESFGRYTGGGEFSSGESGREVDLLFGLDMLKAHQACIDLEKDVLRIQGREVKFLPEHELPLSAQDIDPEALASGSTPSLGTGGNPGGESTSGPPFPGSGRTIGSNPAVAGRPPLQQQASSPQSSRHSETSVKTLMDLGASREQAISLLDAAGGNWKQVSGYAEKDNDK
ncbi:hypothetical protein AGABI2DRAFT_122586 [Agaricus bisporus var. bisporus H97]|uniref:hypothetical protein n=1 Tax=Agaricus bisporus var. bisporus (strain H97 / ATCC MYA-4626 / FGSC 10389) TaxID=936046 RepID=UPI00029F5660|nr:hypothetical protein AGABI2DRAFT_122586 [Agaricus bisporus var. bisporus H97]EKV42358.1 hypothetical protein AGABI2DRAFT_122586 [Agaricus bisporus var. bisporus H97]